jgi:hypothetical protein
MTDNIPDNRYSIRREYCGHDTPRWVVRFRDDWAGQWLESDAGHEQATENARMEDW